MVKPGSCKPDSPAHTYVEYDVMTGQCSQLQVPCGSFTFWPGETPIDSGSRSDINVSNELRRLKRYRLFGHEWHDLTLAVSHMGFGSCRSTHI
ncbi:hypothetical protein N7468_007398 [Penicillium chermesinum]|uniref:Uncharacterized protein n=1 Tax=Penicillium chermesinum TaxID=63820 RepID=A0A9W9TKM4_9EURO|nr:uncharacterized protein N7468_007398 [Penicillium chermesinum]KAJ5226173.1 hypothetical protein N7468_007398 [Penicillium chermesinum]